MARSSRSSVIKANNQRKAAGVFGPVEAARAERLSARLLELARQPKPESSDATMGEANGMFCIVSGSDPGNRMLT